MNKLLLIVSVSLFLISCGTENNNENKLTELDNEKKDSISVSQNNANSYLIQGNVPDTSICSGTATEYCMATEVLLDFDYDKVLNGEGTIIEKKHIFNNEYKTHDTLTTVQYKGNVFIFYISPTNRFIIDADIKNKYAYPKNVRDKFFGNKAKIIKEVNIPCDLNTLKITDDLFQVEVGFIFKGDTVNELLIETNP